MIFTPALIQNPQTSNNPCLLLTTSITLALSNTSDHGLHESNNNSDDKSNYRQPEPETTKYVEGTRRAIMNKPISPEAKPAQARGKQYANSGYRHQP